jgi:hypothetical protein
MPIYRKKPSLVEARQVTPDNFEHLAGWVGHAARRSWACFPAFMWVADTQAYAGDWIVKEANGAFNVYTDEAFRLMHEVD